MYLLADINMFLHPPFVFNLLLLLRVSSFLCCSAWSCNTLAGEYVISISNPLPREKAAPTISENEPVPVKSISWGFRAVAGATTSPSSQGRASKQALLKSPEDDNSEVPILCLLAEAISNKKIVISIQNDKDQIPNDLNPLLVVLSRVLAQQMVLATMSVSDYVAPETSNILSIQFPESRNEVHTFDTGDVLESARRLFHSIAPDVSHAEMVDMVSQKGEPLGCVPRPLVHKYNILHRGMGLFVETVLEGGIEGQDRSRRHWYVHQRTFSKRIFPGLYDMFVGGVSGTGELSYETALREVEEELNLQHGELSQGPLFQCIVCTSYNRCVVDVYSYTHNPTKDTIRWQEEEVIWGAFCDYEIIERAANLSIMRLWQKNEWPGREPRKDPTLHDQSRSEHDWETWDFVPDGLLVWEAWQEYCTK